MTRSGSHGNRVGGLAKLGIASSRSWRQRTFYADLMPPSDAGFELPQLNDAVVVAAFEGWNDAGDAASDALEHLDAIWEADPIVEIDDEASYAYQAYRPATRR